MEAEQDNPAVISATLSGVAEIIKTEFVPDPVIVATDAEDYATLITEAFRGNNSPSVAEKRGRGRPKSFHWRLDFVADNPTTVRARLRRGSGKARSLPDNYIKLGTIEDVYYDPRYRQWKKRCERFCATTGYELKAQPGGTRDRNAALPPEKGMAGITLSEWDRIQIHQLPRTD